MVIDGTNCKEEVREQYIKVAQECGVTSRRCIYFNVDIDTCEKNNQAIEVIEEQEEEKVKEDDGPSSE